MKFDEFRDLKPGDKVIVRVDETDKENHYWTAKLGGIGIGGWIENEAVIAVYHEPTKIKMTVEEKKEFDKLLERHSTADLNDLLDGVWDYPKDYFVLHKRLFGNAKGIIDRKKQFEFARALENPELVEVEKLKKYYVHLFPGERGYLIYFKNSKRYIIDSKEMCGQLAFTEDEIEEINKKYPTLEIKPEALEEVPEDENDI